MNARQSLGEVETVKDHPPLGGVSLPCRFPREKAQPCRTSFLIIESMSFDEQYRITPPAEASKKRRECSEEALAPSAYLRPGGLLPRPPPDGLPVLLGPFSRLVCMVFLQVKTSCRVCAPA